MDCLPIDKVLGELGDALSTGSFAVLEAPPGAGKTTRVPWHLSQSFPDTTVLVSEPRRLAARLAAQRVAEERGERLGNRVGYSVRQELVAGPDTRILYVTDGVLLRRIVSGDLPRPCVVILDEFHERRLESDLCLALLKKIQQASDLQLRLLVMSATLDAQAIAAYLGHCPRIRSQGQRYEVTIDHAKAPDDRPLEKRVSSAVRDLLDTTTGDILVFLPGAHEIRLANSALARLAQEHDLMISPLHGDLPLNEQTRAVKRADRRKVVLATNVAESSVTVDGITGVVDSGMARVLVHDPWSGMDQLALRKVSQASAIQRAGRAGRTADGRVMRLYTLGDFASRPKSDAAEIERLDLSEALLLLRSAKLPAAGDLEFLTPPKASSLGAAEALLHELGALDDQGSLTPLAKRLLDFPLHPRLARIVVEGEARGVAAECCLVAALLSERDVRRQSDLFDPQRHYDADAESDVLELVALYCAAETNDFDAQSLAQFGLDRRAIQQVRSSTRRLTKLLASRSAPLDDASAEPELLNCIAAGYIDRLAQRTSPGRTLLMANGKLAELAAESAVHRAPLIVAVRVSERRRAGRRGHALVWLASKVDEQWLFQHAFDRLVESEEFEFNANNQRVERVSRIRFGRIVLDETRRAANPGPDTAEALFRAAMAKGAHLFDRDTELENLVLRLEVLAEYQPDLDLPASEELSFENVLKRACQHAASLDELKQRGLAETVRWALPEPVLSALDRQVPTHLTLPSGRRVAVHYVKEQTPFVASRLQDFFSMTETPTICGGRLALLVQLLAPNQRAVQVTRDLAGFWERHYPALRKQLMRRYPKHAWPEDGRTATPPAARHGASRRR